MKTLYKIGMLAVAALAFAGCSKEVDVQKEKTTGTHTLTFKVQKDIDTKTAVVEGNGVASYVWTTKDDQYFHIYENGVAATDISMELSENNTIATFKATFADTEATEFSYTAVYGSDVSGAGNPMIIDEQTPALNSFDPAADVLVSSKPITLDGNAAADEDTEFLFTLKRVVSVNKMTLKGLTAGEKVTTVELASDQYFSARYGVEKETYTGNQKKLVFDFSGLDDAVVGTDGTFPVYFVSAPVENATFSVRVVTESAIYMRDDFTSKLNLAVGTFRRFGINLEGYGEEISEGTVYTLVETQDDLFDGATYIIAATDVNVVMGLYTGGNNHPTVTVNKGTDASGKSIITVDNSLEVEPVLIASSGNSWIMKNAAPGNTYEGQYLICGTGTNNRLQETSSESNAYKEWSIEISNGDAVIVNKNSSASRTRLFYNNSNDIFACYAPDNTSYKTISLYVDKSTCVELADPELSFDGEATINVAWADIDNFEAPALSNPHNLTVTYSSSDPDVATVDAATGEIEFVGNGTTVITASSSKTEVYNAGSAQYTLIVTGAPVPHAFTTVAELNEMASTTATEYFGSLTNAVISFVPDTKNAVIKDATGSVLVFKEGHGFKQGQTFSGDLTVTLTLYNKASEITAIDATFTGTEAVVAPQSVTLADLVGNFATWQNAYVEVEDLEVVSVSGKNINVKNGDKTYVVYSSAGNATCAPGDILKVTGTIAQYSSKDQVKAWTMDAIEITQEHQMEKHTITFTQPEAGGSFTVKVNGEAIESGAELLEGTIVSLNASVENGYSFNGWTVTGAVVSGNTVSETFTVGTDNVSISANISKDGASTTVEFTGTNSGGMTTTAGEQSGTIDGVTIEISNGLVNGDQIRVYKNATFTVSAPENKVVSKIEFTCTASGTSNYGPGGFAGSAGYSYSGYVGTWVGSSSSVTLTASGSQVRATSIKVTYE